MSKKFALKGINDDESTCSVCGKQELHKVMWLVELGPDGDELGDAFPVGTTCGARMLGLKTAEFSKSVKKAQDDIARQKRVAIFNHSLTKLMNEEIKFCAEKNIRYAERKAQGYIDRWNKWGAIVNEWANNQNFISEVGG